MQKKICLLIICLLFIALPSKSAYVRQKNGYAIYQNKMVTTYYLVDNNGAKVSTKEYFYLSRVTSDLFIAFNGSKYGLIDSKSNNVINFEYDDIRLLKTGIFRIKLNQKYGLMDYTGKILLPPKYPYLEKIDDRRLKVSTGTSEKGNEGQQLGQNDNKTAGALGLMDYKGNVLSEMKYSYIDKINNYMLRVRVGAANANQTENKDNSTGGKYGIIDYYGRNILNAEYDYLSKISNTMLKIKKGNNWGRVEFYNGNILNISYDYQSGW